MRLGGVTAAVACVVALPSCGGLGDLIGAGDQAGEPRVATVVVLVPDSGEYAADGAGVAAAVQTALADAAPSGWEVEVERVADGAARSAAGEVAAEIADDDDVIAVIGGLSAEVVRAVQPILDRNGIPFISPADASPEHTRGPDPSAPLRPYETYFRTAVVGEEPEGLAARYAADGLGVDAMVVVQHERVAEARRVAERARSLGVQVAAAEPGDIASGLSIARESDAGAVYVAGTAEFAAAVTTEVVRSGLDAWVIGGADLHDDDFLNAAGATASRSVAIVPSTLDTTINRAVPGLADAGRFGAAAYDAGSAVAAALDQCLPPVREGRAGAARTGCVAEFGAVSLKGVTGELTFDRFGDRPGAWPSAYVVVDGEWQEVAGAMTR
ncbi:MAG TPA: ABC transporter substrate-binding protein [Jiangellaceae bacterium]